MVWFKAGRVRTGVAVRRSTADLLPTAPTSYQLSRDSNGPDQSRIGALKYLKMDMDHRRTLEGSKTHNLVLRVVQQASMFHDRLLYHSFVLAWLASIGRTECYREPRLFHHISSSTSSPGSLSYLLVASIGISSSRSPFTSEPAPTQFLRSFWIMSLPAEMVAQMAAPKSLASRLLCYVSLQFGNSWG